MSISLPPASLTSLKTTLVLPNPSETISVSPNYSEATLIPSAPSETVSVPPNYSETTLVPPTPSETISVLPNYSETTLIPPGPSETISVSPTVVGATSAPLPANGKITTSSTPRPLQTTHENFGITTSPLPILQTTQAVLPTYSTGTTGSSPILTNSVSTTPGYASIAGFALNPISAQEFGRSFTVVWNMTAGTSVTIAVSYNGIPCCNAGPITNTGGQCDCLMSDPGFFDPDGVVNISAVASNLLSNSPSSIEVEVLKIIAEVSLTILASYSDFGMNIEGRGSQRNVFPAEHPAKFNCSYTGNVSVNSILG